MHGVYHPFARSITWLVLNDRVTCVLCEMCRLPFGEFIFSFGYKEIQLMFVVVMFPGLMCSVVQPFGSFKTQILIHAFQGFSTVVNASGNSGKH